MQIDSYYLTYCTNIHPAETWEDTEASLRQYIPQIKKAVAPNQPMGIGLRLSHIASETLAQDAPFNRFKLWLAEQNAYVFTMNGFPYGNFHHDVVKGDVHTPDWTTQQRLDYTIRLFDILAALLPEGMDGGISTSPLSYKIWHKDADVHQVMKQATLNIAVVAEHLHNIRQHTGQLLHLDIEPEPDGVLESTQEVINFYRHWLIPLGTAYLKEHLGLSDKAAEECLKTHIQICYDVCHFAIVYEEPTEAFRELQAEGIKIGKIQISAALKASLNTPQKQQVLEAFSSFAEPTYLHQVVQKNTDSTFIHFDDLPTALEHVDDVEAVEWRTHFHVPVFLDSYGLLESTQDDITKVLYYLQAGCRPAGCRPADRVAGQCRPQIQVTTHLEVETYTWEVLPQDIQLPLAESVIRELQWVKQHMSK